MPIPLVKGQIGGWPGSGWAFMESGSEDFAIVKCRYLAVQNIPYYVDSAGRVLFERSWHHDLIQHLHYLPEFMLAAPLRPLPPHATPPGRTRPGPWTLYMINWRPAGSFAC